MPQTTGTHKEPLLENGLGIYKKIWEYERVGKADQRAKKLKLEHNAKLIEGKRKQPRKTHYISTPMMKSIKAQETLNIYRRIED